MCTKCEGEQLIILEYALINFETNTHFCFCENTHSIFDSHVDSLVFLMAWLHDSSLVSVCHLKLFNYFWSQISLTERLNLFVHVFIKDGIQINPSLRYVEPGQCC